MPVDPVPVSPSPEALAAVEIRAVLDRLAEGLRKCDRDLISAEFTDIPEFVDELVQRGQPIQFETATPWVTGGSARAEVTTFEYIENDESQSHVGCQVLLQKVDGRWKAVNVRKRRRSTTLR